MPRAQRDLKAIYDWIGASSPGAARKWYLGLKEATRSLRNIPRRDPVTPEDKNLRHLLYGRSPHIYRVIYRIVEKEKTVEVLHIRHGARAGFSDEDLGP